MKSRSHPSSLPDFAAQLPARARLDFLFWFHHLIPILGQHTGVIEALKKVPGVPYGTARKKFYALKSRGAVGLINKRLVGSKKMPLLPPELALAPIPRRGRWEELIESMEVGDSVLLTRSECCVLYKAAAAKGITVTARKEGTKRRVWRVAGEQAFAGNLPRIDHGIPLPVKSKWGALLERMRIGDSVVLSTGHGGALIDAANLRKIKIVSRAAGGKRRYWRAS